MHKINKITYATYCIILFFILVSFRFLTLNANAFPYTIPYVLPYFLLGLYVIRNTYTATVLSKTLIRFGWLSFLILPSFGIWSFPSLFSWTLCFYTVTLLMKRKRYSWPLCFIMASLTVLVGSVMYELPVFYTMTNDLTSLLFNPYYPMFISRHIVSSVFLLYMISVIKVNVKDHLGKLFFSIGLYTMFFPFYVENPSTKFLPYIYIWIPRGLTIIVLITIIHALYCKNYMTQKNKP